MSEDAEARKIVKERGASETFGDLSRYARIEEYKQLYPSLWVSTCNDFIESCKAGVMQAEITEIPLEANAVEQAMADIANMRNCGRLLVKI
jgi:hypothetical protein